MNKGTHDQETHDVGLAARQAAAALLHAVLDKGQAFDEAFSAEAGHEPLKSAALRDRGFARAIAATALRRLGEIDFILAQFIETDLPKRAGIAYGLLRGAAAEMLFLGVKPHASVASAVEAASRDAHAKHFKSLINAVLRRVANEGAALLASVDSTRLNTPEWLWASWTHSYGEEIARAIAAAHLHEAALDLSVKRDDERALWAERLGARVLATGTLRLDHAGHIEELPGFTEGAWWVQDAAAALPPRLLSNIAGQDVLDLCAAPGGKTLSLAARGAHVTALDRSSSRLARLRENLARLNLSAKIITADAGSYAPGRQWSHILLDAPCTATGTARRHPDVLRLKSHLDRDRLTKLQARLLAHAATLLAPNGTLVYCTCSLEEEEGAMQIDNFLAEHRNFVRQPVGASEVGGLGELLSAQGDLRSLPCHLAAQGGLDGFYVTRLIREV